MGFHHCTTESRLIEFGHFQRFNVAHETGFIEDTHNNLLSPNSRKSSHTNVNLSSSVIDREATILRDSTLSDVNVRHDLQT